MEKTTVYDVLKVGVILTGGATLIVLLSYPINSISNYITGSIQHKQQQEQFDRQVNKAESYVPQFVRNLLPKSSPQAGLVPPPPPLMF